MKVKDIIKIEKKELKLVLIKFLSLILFLSFVSCINYKGSKQKLSFKSIPCQLNSDLAPILFTEDDVFKAYMTKSPLLIDGCSKDSIWTRAQWYDMNYNWMGEAVDSVDYYGKFKLAWDKQYLYILVEVIDEHLNPTLGNGIENYWKGDYVEVFIDEDKSGGNHQFNHQAFAYHVSTEGHAIDKSISKETIFFDDHVEVKRSQEGNVHLWEMAIKLFNNEFDENAADNTPVEIVNQKSIGFSIAYGDNDGNNSRENFMGSKKTHGNNNDEGYINSDVFGSIIFIA
jgi:hypothetical protein